MKTLFGTLYNIDNSYMMNSADHGMVLWRIILFICVVLDYNLFDPKE